MRKNYFYLCLLIVLGINVQLFAQTDPGIANLKHQWTFDDGTAKDYVGGADGTLQGGATISSKALNTTNGGWLEMPASTIAVNTYAGLTAEIWFTSKASANSGCKMLAYLGNTTGTSGTDYLFITPAGCSYARVAVSCGNTSSPWSVEDGINYSSRIDDGLVHQLIATLDGTTMTYYIDGISVGTTTFTGSNAISALGTQFAYLAKGGYTGDGTWYGFVNKYSLYDKALSADEVLYLYQHGAESTAVISPSISSVAFDENYNSTQFTVSSTNLTSDIIVTAPDGIIVSPTTITANAKDVSVVAFFSGSNIVNGNITLTSGSTVVDIPIKTAIEATCYTPLYTDVLNIITDPGVNDLSFFGGWGAHQIITIANDPDLVYCGASCGEVGNGTSPGGGSLDFVLTGKITPNTTYRVKAMVKTVDGSFQLGVYGYDSSQGDLNNVIDTNGEWEPLDFTFTTGATLKDTHGLFWNCSGSCTGKLGYIDNWEMYIAQDQIIKASTQYLSYDPEYLSSSFTVTASNLMSDITITAPTGITVSPTTLPSTAAGETVTVTYDGTTAVNGNISLTSGSAVINIPVVTITQSNTTCFSALEPTKPNLIPDPYGNDATKFGGWGSKSFVTVAEEPDSVYCGSHSGRIAGGSGSIDVSLVNIIKKNTPYIARIMAKSIGEFQFGVAGIDVNGVTSDVDSLFNTQGVWKHVILEFTTGDSLRVNDQPLFVNNYQKSGTRCYIDNWELYEKSATAVKNVFNQIKNIYIQNGKIVADFEATNNSQVQLSVYTIQGTIVSDEKFTPNIGRNIRDIDVTLLSGMYIVKLTQNDQSSFKKLIK